MKAPQLICTLLAGVLMTGCASQLAVTDIALAPAEVNIGDVSVITVTFTGPKNVASVVGFVREVEGYIFDLVNDGTNGDVKANDNIWTLGIPIPMEAAPGNYSLDITAKDVDGNPIPQKGMEVSTDGYVGTVVVTVK